LPKWEKEEEEEEEGDRKGEKPFLNVFFCYKKSEIIFSKASCDSSESEMENIINTSRIHFISLSFSSKFKSTWITNY
jgi:hypothetical protein